MNLTADHEMASSTTHILPYKNARTALNIGSASAVLASICCLGTFLLVTIGYSSAKILYLLTLADWSRPFFILVALVSILYSYNNIWNPASICTAKGGCMNEKEIMMYKCYYLFVVSLVISVLMLPYFGPNIG